jgi:adenylate cyclase
MWGVSIDFEAEGLLDGLSDESARARLELLRTLEREGFTLDELRRAAGEDRLALLPVERVLEAEGPRYTLREVAEASGLELRFLEEARRALGDPAVDPDASVLTD